MTRRHPGRAVRDSHTPQALKLQMGLAAVTAPGVPCHRPGEPGWLVVERGSTGGWPARRPGFRTDRDSLSGESLAPGSRRDFARGRPAVGARVRPGDRIRPGADPLSRPLRREPAADCWLAAGRQAPHGCRSGGDDPGRDGAADGGHRAPGETRFAWSDLLSPDAHGARWPALPHLQVSHHGGSRRGDVAPACGSGSARPSRPSSFGATRA